MGTEYEARNEKAKCEARFNRHTHTPSLPISPMRIVLLIIGCVIVKVDEIIIEVEHDM